MVRTHSWGRGLKIFPYTNTWFLCGFFFFLHHSLASSLLPNILKHVLCQQVPRSVYLNRLFSKSSAWLFSSILSPCRILFKVTGRHSPPRPFFFYVCTTAQCTFQYSCSCATTQRWYMDRLQQTFSGKKQVKSGATCNQA